MKAEHFQAYSCRDSCFCCRSNELQFLSGIYCSYHKENDSFMGIEVHCIVKQRIKNLYWTVNINAKFYFRHVACF